MWYTTFMKREDWYQEIHKRLLSKDPIASAELVENVLKILIHKLTYKYNYLDNSEIIYDAVIDAIMDYIKNPHKFNPTKRGLPGYLYMAAEGDLINEIAKIKRREQKEILTNDVELISNDGNLGIEEGIGVNSYDVLQAHDKACQIINRLFANEKDKEAAMLILQGERSTDAFAKVLCIDYLPPEKQRKEVKRVKDRIKKCLNRSGDKYNEQSE